ncbi:MAG: hypothetical protein DA328_07945 [Nitrososphaeraceae archaeon]|nr:hypothetical protein [Nitrososphaeraceae archaeon]
MTEESNEEEKSPNIYGFKLSDLQNAGIAAGIGLGLLALISPHISKLFNQQQQPQPQINQEELIRRYRERIRQRKLAMQQAEEFEDPQNQPQEEIHQQQEEEIEDPGQNTISYPSLDELKGVL